MLILIALLYFCVVCCVIGLFVFPTARELMHARLVSIAQRAGQRQWAWRPQVRVDWRRGLRGAARAAFKYLRRHRVMFAIGGPVVAIPPLLALVLRSPAMLPDAGPTEPLPDAKVAALLKGEHLVPPVALPPLAFSTPEVELVRPMLADASRNWGLLHPEFSQRLLLAFRIMREQHGYEMALLEGYRSPSRQDMLAKMGSQVTNARAWQSWHQYGLAADCAFWRDGKLVISEKDPWAMRGYRLYGQVAESLGLTWGGRWTMTDLGHTELRLRGAMRRPG
ncbi:M15 family metallopeptidase [Massilia solisilvae]|uniref:M15 family metallopeptidase n=1 Tax=Massilia solisilvae TaxID=1811225 RepID=A0ABT2BR93_9BURK|nr:M15 family metallopeptidase [Massilia solisilvae]MCS0610921.1 M15 family metallopeptidase [Massilia solisilvae]